MTWTDVTVAGAFIAGCIAGAAAVIRTTRWLLDYFASAILTEQQPRHEPRPQADEDE